MFLKTITLVKLMSVSNTFQQRPTRTKHSLQTAKNKLACKLMIFKKTKTNIKQSRRFMEIHMAQHFRGYQHSCHFFKSTHFRYGLEECVPNFRSLSFIFWSGEAGRKTHILIYNLKKYRLLYRLHA